MMLYLQYCGCELGAWYRVCGTLMGQLVFDQRPDSKTGRIQSRRLLRSSHRQSPSKIPEAGRDGGTIMWPSSDEKGIGKNANAFKRTSNAFKRLPNAIERVLVFPYSPFLSGRSQFPVIQNHRAQRSHFIRLLRYVNPIFWLTWRTHEGYRRTITSHRRRARASSCVHASNKVIRRDETCCSMCTGGYWWRKWRHTWEPEAVVYERMPRMHIDSLKCHPSPRPIPPRGPRRERLAWAPVGEWGEETDDISD